MLEEITKRQEKDFAGGSRASEPLPSAQGFSLELTSSNFLIAVIVLAIVDFALILIIIYGYFKYVRGRGKMEGGESKETSSNAREEVRAGGGEDIEQPPLPLPPQSMPVKMRKRSMTFSETDEECRKYRENLADSDPKPETSEKPEPFRKKSTVTFVGVEEIDP